MFDMEDPTAFVRLTNEFSAWLELNDIKASPKIKLADLRTRSAGRGVVATADIASDEDLFSIPRSAILLPESSTIPANCLQNLSDPWLRLILAMIWEYQQGSKSRWHAYFNVLPRSFDTLMFWSQQELALLQGSAVLGKIGRASAEQTFADKIIPVVEANKHGFRADQLSRERLVELSHQMGSTIMAYAFDLESGDQGDDGSSNSQDSWAEDDEQTLPVGMVPLADMLNANADLNNAKLYYEADRVVMRSVKDIRAGEEVYNDYGPLPRADLLRRYGYITEQYAKYDVVEIERDLVIKMATEMTPTTVQGVHARLDYLEDLDVPTDGFEIMHGEQNEPQIASELIAAANVLTLPSTDFAEISKKRARPARSLSSSQPEAIDLLHRILSARLAQYDNQVSFEALDKASPTSQRRAVMAEAVVKGEQYILETALAQLQESTSQSAKRKTASHDEDGRSHKKRA